MRSYEGVFIYPPESGPDARKEETATLEDLVKRVGGKITEKNEWGKRPLGYKIKKFREGYFVVLNLEISPDKVNEFQRGLELDEKIIKCMLTVRHPRKERASKKSARATAAKAPAEPAKT